MLIRKLKALWGMLKMVKVVWQNEQHAAKTLTPQQAHERQFIRAVQCMWAEDRNHNDRMVERYWQIAYNEGCWLQEHGIPLPVVPGQYEFDPPVQEALDEYLKKFGY